MLEIKVRHCHCALVGDNSDYRAAPPADQKDEPLAEENEKLKEAMNLMEKNIQRAQRERDLAESNAWDLEY